MEKTEELFIDLDKIIKSKNPNLYRIIPGFILSYLKKIIRQNEINDFIKRNGNRWGIDFSNRVIEEFNVNLIVNNEEKIPATGRYIFASNHPLGALESVALMKIVHTHFPELRFMVNDLLMSLKNFEPLFIPVNKHGRNGAEYYKILNDTFESEAQVLVFPAGMVSRKTKGIIRDLEWKKSFISMSVKHQRDIIPVYINARNRNFFYNLANFRKKIGIKTNIEMLFLPDELFRQYNKTIEITFGSPVPYQTFDKSKTPAEWAGWMKGLVYAMEKNK